MLKHHKWRVDPTLPKPEGDEDAVEAYVPIEIEPQRPLLCGFIKARSEIVREGNIYRAIAHLKRYCDTIVACDDGSYDGTREFLQAEIPPDQLILVPSSVQDFRKELFWKQCMLEVVHRLRPYWIWWLDADEELERDGVRSIREFCKTKLNAPPVAYRSHYIQLWRNASWHRTDDGFADGRYIKLWRWHPKLSFEVVDKTHHAQFPQQLHQALAQGRVGDLPWRVVHWGNYGTNLRWKCLQYWGGLGGVERHLSFESATFEKAPAIVSGIRTNDPMPLPFSEADKARIRSFRDLRKLGRAFTVVIPTHNRGAFLDAALASLLAQTYEHWLALVIDNGSTDDTPAIMRRWQDTDPRIFYVPLPNKGAVVANEIGMACAVEWTEWWTRLGSDDYFEPRKLELDALALSQYPWVYGPYRVLRDDKLAEVCNLPRDPKATAQGLLNGQFAISWANSAVHCALLRAVRDRFGNFCDPRLRNMEDFLVNVRLARFAEPVFRGCTKQGSSVLNPTAEFFSGVEYQHDAIWRVNPIGASADTVTTGNEDDLTRQIIAAESATWKVPS